MSKSGLVELRIDISAELAPTKRKPPKRHGEPARPAGFYTELIRRHNWPPSFTSRMPAPQAKDYSAIASETRDRHGFSGTIFGVSAKADALIKQFKWAR